MKIRCKNCYRILNQNEEYCTSCGEYSSQMHKAMLTGDFGPDPIGKFKIGLGVFAIAGFIVCGILQVIFATLENKNNGGNGYTLLYCQSNSLFYSSIFASVITLIFFFKDLKNLELKSTKSQWLGTSLVVIFTIAIAILFSFLSRYTLILPSYITEYLQSGSAVFFNLKDECILKILVGTLLSSLCLEILMRKTLIDALDETMLGDKAIYAITVLVTTLCEIAWVMALDISIVALLVNIVATGIYMYTNRNLVINLAMRALLVIVAVVVFIL